MSDCYNCNISKQYEDKIDDLRYTIRSLRDDNDNLMGQLRESEDNLYSAEFRIREELEPRIKAEKRSYDNWATSGGSDECMSNGINGNCGLDCSAFGSKLECFDTTTTIYELVDYEHCVSNMGYIEVEEDYCNKTPLSLLILNFVNKFIKRNISKIKKKRCARCWRRALDECGIDYIR